MDHFSFRADKRIKHCRIKREGRLYTIGTAEFESLVELINYYQRYPLYKKVMLKRPLTEDMVRGLTEVSEMRNVHNLTNSEYISKSTIYVLYRFIAPNRPYLET